MGALRAFVLRGFGGGESARGEDFREFHECYPLGEHETLSSSITFSDAMRPQFEDVAHHPARPHEPRTGL
jgi:hypothetical protein